MKTENPEGKLLTFVNRKVNMRLVRIARVQWDVLAVMDERRRCQVLDFFAEPGSEHSSSFLLWFIRSGCPSKGRHAARRSANRSGTEFTNCGDSPKGQS